MPAKPAAANRLAFDTLASSSGVPAFANPFSTRSPNPQTHVRSQHHGTLAANQTGIAFDRMVPATSAGMAAPSAAIAQAMQGMRRPGPAGASAATPAQVVQTPVNNSLLDRLRAAAAHQQRQQQHYSQQSGTAEDLEAVYCMHAEESSSIDQPAAQPASIEKQGLDHATEAAVMPATQPASVSGQHEKQQVTGGQTPAAQGDHDAVAVSPRLTRSGIDTSNPQMSLPDRNTAAVPSITRSSQSACLPTTGDSSDAQHAKAAGVLLQAQENMHAQAMTLYAEPAVKPKRRKLLSRLQPVTL